MNRLAASTLLTAALLATSAHTLQAQTPALPVSKDGALPPPAKDIVNTTDPADRPVHGSLTAGVQFTSGVTESRGGAFDGTISRAYSERGKLVARGTYNYARVTLGSPGIDTVQTNRGQFAVGVDQALATHLVFQARSLYLRDTVQQIFSRYEELAGLGYLYTDAAKRVDFSFVPAISALKQRTFLATDEGWQAAAGLREQLGVKFNTQWSVDQGFSYRHNLSDHADSLEHRAALTGLIAKGLGLQVQHLYVRESLVPPGVPPYQQVFQVGLQVKF